MTRTTTSMRSVGIGIGIGVGIGIGIQTRCHQCQCQLPPSILRLSSSSSSSFLSPDLTYRSAFSLRRRRSRAGVVRAGRRGESPYEVLGVPPSASPEDIKRAFRRLALKFHPDVYKEPDAQERFMRIKHAYNALINSQSRYKPPSSGPGANYSTSKTVQQEAYDDFIRYWGEVFPKEENPKSLWEELSEIGEEFVEFLEKELNVKDSHYDGDSMGSQQKEDDVPRQSVEQSIDEVEAALAQLKKELGL
ncbi:Chaperone protein DnaJ [Rhynchospora pubera]|uniref:Chaperone protein DnaJ n=1 Tax=Rhynchospora pubera TaxID=906938 RepID=A0AAV8CVP1_9POAL|nr:Chaperone protein DnaJ [Rhynchospora pubera]